MKYKKKRIHSWKLYVIATQCFFNFPEALENGSKIALIHQKRNYFLSLFEPLLLAISGFRQFFSPLRASMSLSTKVESWVPPVPVFSFNTQTLKSLSHYFILLIIVICLFSVPISLVRT